MFGIESSNSSTTGQYKNDDLDTGFNFKSSRSTSSPRSSPSSISSPASSPISSCNQAKSNILMSHGSAFPPVPNPLLYLSALQQEKQKQDLIKFLQSSAGVRPPNDLVLDPSFFLNHTPSSLNTSLSSLSCSASSSPSLLSSGSNKTSYSDLESRLSKRQKLANNSGCYSSRDRIQMLKKATKSSDEAQLKAYAQNRQQQPQSAAHFNFLSPFLGMPNNFEFSQAKSKLPLFPPQANQMDFALNEQNYVYQFLLASYQQQQQNILKQSFIKQESVDFKPFIEPIKLNLSNSSSGLFENSTLLKPTHPVMVKFILD